MITRAAAVADWISRRAGLVFLFWSLFYNLEKYALGPWSYVTIGDEADSRLAFIVGWWHWFFEPFQHYRGSQALGGFDALGAAVDPGLEALLCLVMPDWTAFAVLRIFCVFLQGYFVYRLLRDVLGVRTSLAFAGGLIYPALIHHYLPDEQLFGALPLIIWALHRPWGRAGRQCTVMIALAAFYTFFSVYAFTLFTLPTVWLWSLVFFGLDRQWWAKWRPTIVFTIAYLVLNLPHLIAGAMNGGEAARSYGVSPYDSMRGVLMIGTTGYWGPILLILLLAGFAAWRDARLLRLFTLYGGLAIAGPIAYFSAQLLTILFPGLGFASQIALRFYDSAPLIMIVASVQLFDTTLARLPFGTARRRETVLVACSIAAMALAVGLAIDTKLKNVWELLHGSAFAAAYHHPQIRDLARETASEREAFRVLTFNAFRKNYRFEEGFLWGYGFETAGGFTNLWPMRYREIWMNVILAPIIAIDPTVVPPLNNKLYLPMLQEKGLIWAMCNDDLPNCRIRPSDYYRIALLSFLNVRYLVSPYPLDDPSLELIPSRERDLLLAREELRTREKWKLNLQGEYGLGTALFVYRNRDVLPRYFLVDRVRSYATDAELFDALSTISVAELHEAAYLDTQTAQRLPPFAPARERIPVKQVRATSDRVTLQTNASNDALLVTSMGYSRFWKACIDKVPSEVVRLNHAFVGIVTPGGTHEIDLFYDPPYRFGPDPC